jgi:TPR repeat protein
MDALLKRAALLMEEGDWQKADELLEHVCNNYPENAQVYFGKVLVQLKLPSAKALIQKATELGITSLKEYKDYEKALRFADASFHFQLQCYDPANREDIYLEVASLLKSSKSFEKCRKAMMLLKYIPQGHKDVDSLAQQLKEAEQVYLKYREVASRLNKSQFLIQDYRAALEMIIRLPPSYTEIDTLANKCKEAIELFINADLGGADGQFNLGVAYMEGRNVPQNDAEAVKWHRKAADQGHAGAQDNLGVMYGNGRGIPQNDGEAVKWHRRAAEQGHANAQYNLGVAYWERRGVPRNYAEAVRWWRKAAEHGHAIAQYHLGIAYWEGRGVPRNDAEAVRWWHKAAEQGDAYAQDNLRAFYGQTKADRGYSSSTYGSP